jgi:hypothetical protein
MINYVMSIEHGWDVGRYAAEFCPTRDALIADSANGQNDHEYERTATAIIPAPKYPSTKPTYEHAVRSWSDGQLHATPTSYDERQREWEHEWESKHSAGIPSQYAIPFFDVWGQPRDGPVYGYEYVGDGHDHGGIWCDGSWNSGNGWYEWRNTSVPLYGRRTRWTWSIECQHAALLAGSQFPKSNVAT